MIRVATRKPRIYFQKAWNDMGSFFPSSFEVSGDWFWMSLDQYMEKTGFENFDMSGDKISKREKDNIASRVVKGEDISDIVKDPDSQITYPWLYQLNWWLDKSKQRLWEFNAPNKNLDGWIRQVAILGEPNLVKISWFEARIKFPVLKYICKYLNKCLYFKRKKEIKEWEEFRKNV